MIRILPKIEYLLQPEKAEKRIKSIDIPVNSSAIIKARISPTKLKEPVIIIPDEFWRPN